MFRYFFLGISLLRLFSFGRLAILILFNLFQADTFKNWINVNLKEVGFFVESLETDFQVRIEPRTSAISAAP